jgi:hypothetical protein
MEAGQFGMARPGITVVIAALTVGLVGCGVAGAGPAVVAGTGGGVMIGESARMLPVLTSAQAEGLPPIAWLLAGIDDGGRRVDMTIVYGGGKQPVGVQVTQTAKGVTLTVRSERFPPGAIVHMNLRFGLFTVNLPEPLGSRRLLGFSGHSDPRGIKVVPPQNPPLPAESDAEQDKG